MGSLLLLSNCKPESTPSPAQTGTLTDRDGKVYNTIKIGNQWWMTEDLKTTTYQNGDPIVYKDSTTVLWLDTAPGYCFVDTTSWAIGMLYNWYAVSDARKIAPVGWHIPTDDEWKTLEMYLGMSSADADKVNFRGTDEGDKLKREKAANQIVGSWDDANNVYIIWPNNQSGFSALAGSCRMFFGSFGDQGIGATEFWWSASEHTGSNEVWYRYLDYNKSNIFRFYGDKRYGFSVRCVKD
jgi:uncharacterized protein (TIGR02145 family)